MASTTYISNAPDLVHREALRAFDPEAIATGNALLPPIASLYWNLTVRAEIASIADEETVTYVAQNPPGALLDGTVVIERWWAYLAALDENETKLDNLIFDSPLEVRIQDEAGDSVSFRQVEAKRCQSFGNIACGDSDVGAEAIGSSGGPYDPVLCKPASGTNTIEFFHLRWRKFDASYTGKIYIAGAMGVKAELYPRESYYSQSFRGRIASLPSYGLT